MTWTAPLPESSTRSYAVRPAERVIDHDGSRLLVELLEAEAYQLSEARPEHQREQEQAVKAVTGDRRKNGVQLFAT